MSAMTRPRGPLPPQVYWFRRVLVLVVACLLVVGIARLLGGSSDAGADAAEAARPVGASFAASPGASGTPSAAPSAAPQPSPGTTSDTRRAGKRRAAATPAPLPEPSGPCRPGDIRVVPDVDGAVAGSDVLVTLNLTTLSTPACTWTVSARSVVLRLTSGSDRIWSTQDCPAAVGRHEVVVYRDAPTAVGVTWSGQRSDEDCSRTMPWAAPGYYYATAAALGAEPAEQQFQLVAPTPATITPEPEPRKKKRR